MEPLQHCIKTVKSKAVIFGYELSPGKNYGALKKLFIRKITLITIIELYFKAIKDIVETNKDEFSKIALFCTGSKENSLFNMNGATCATVTDLDLEIKSVPTNSPPNLGRSTVSDGLCYTFTSGTTGLPKGVLMKQHRYNLFNELANKKRISFLNC
jgi:long-subunit acyl-CoA synthetase (AMP-forming)